MFQPKNTNRQTNKGAAIIITVIFFLIISVVLMIGVSIPTSNQIKGTRDLLKSKQSYIAADAVNDEALYRLNQAWSLPPSMVLSFSDGVTATAEVTDVGETKQITSTGVAGSLTRISKSILSQGLGVSINYGLQVGNGGVNMINNAVIIGNVYANGDITGVNNAEITGSAISAAIASTIPEVENGSTSTPTNSIDLGRTGSALTEYAQSFTVSTSTPVLYFSFNIKKTGTPANLTLKVMTNSSGSPSNTQVGSNGTMSASTVTGSYGWINVYPTSGITLTPGTTYWVKLVSSATSATNYYTLGTSIGGYGDGLVKTKTSSGSWSEPTPVNQDAHFKVYTGDTSTISGMTIGGLAKAFNVTGSTITGALYCQTGSSNNKACDTSQTPPAPQAFAVSEANIDEWILEASSGTTKNGFSLSGSEATTTTGALKVNGSINLSGDAVMTLNGPLYVTGNINLSNDGKIKLASSYTSSSGFIVVDGTVTTSNGGEFMGSGTSESYIVLASKNGNINISNNGGSVALITLNGTIDFSNNATAKSAMGYRMQMSNNAVITYESGLGDVNFTTGPSGAWTVDSWKEVAE